MALPETVSTGAFVTRTVINVRPGRPAPAGVNVITSCATDHENEPLIVGTVTKLVCTLFVSMDLLN